MLLAVWNISEVIGHVSGPIRDAKLVGKFPIAFGGVHRTPTFPALYREGSDGGAVVARDRCDSFPDEFSGAVGCRA